MLPPYWSLGYHLSRWGYRSSDDVINIVEAMKSAKIPLEVQWVDIDYMEDHKGKTSVQLKNYSGDIFRFYRWFCELGINEKSFWYASWKWSEICSYIGSRNTFRSWPWLQTSQGSMASLICWLYLSLIPFSCYWAWEGRFYSWWRGYSSNRNRIPNQLISNNCLISW